MENYPPGRLADTAKVQVTSGRTCYKDRTSTLHNWFVEPSKLMAQKDAVLVTRTICQHSQLNVTVHLPVPPGWHPYLQSDSVPAPVMLTSHFPKAEGSSSQAETQRVSFLSETSCVSRAHNWWTRDQHRSRQSPEDNWRPWSKKRPWVFQLLQTIHSPFQGDRKTPDQVDRKEQTFPVE